MKAYICDQCGRQVPPSGSYELPPTGWISLTIDGKTEHFCTESCALVRLVERNEPVAARAYDKEATS